MHQIAVTVTLAVGLQTTAKAMMTAAEADMQTSAEAIREEIPTVRRAEEITIAVMIDRLMAAMRMVLLMVVVDLPHPMVEPMALTMELAETIAHLAADLMVLLPVVDAVPVVDEADVEDVEDVVTLP